MIKFTYPIRINRYLALNNYATRKGADGLISRGLVTINKKKAVLGDLVYEDDQVEVKNSVFKKEYVYYAYNKPIGVSTNPEPGAKDILKVAKFSEHVFPVGRLDKDSHGLIIMTNDGRITDRLLSPKYIHEKEYIVKTESPFTDNFINNLQKGVRIERIMTRKCKAWRFNKNTFHIILTEGKKHQIRRMCEALHHKVIDLKRIRVINIQLSKIPENSSRKIEGKELDDFLKLLKLV